MLYLVQHRRSLYATSLHFLVCCTLLYPVREVWLHCTTGKRGILQPSHQSRSTTWVYSLSCPPLAIGHLSCLDPSYPVLGRHLCSLIWLYYVSPQRGTWMRLPLLSLVLLCAVSQSAESRAIEIYPCLTVPDYAVIFLFLHITMIPLHFACSSPE